MLESKDYGSYTLYPLTEYLDRARHLKLLSTRFKHFAGIAEEGTDWYTPQRLIKLLNLCLMQNNSALRLVEVESGDQTSNILLIEPRMVKSLLNKYSITSWAIDHNDDYYYAQ